MISLRAPKILIFRPSQTELARLFGLLRSSLSTFSPSLTAQTLCARVAHATAQSMRTSSKIFPISFSLISNKLLPFALILRRQLARNQRRLRRVRFGFRDAPGGDEGEADER